MQGPFEISCCWFARRRKTNLLQGNKRVEVSAERELQDARTKAVHRNKPNSTAVTRTTEYRSKHRQQNRPRGTSPCPPHSPSPEGSGPRRAVDLESVARAMRTTWSRSRPIVVARVSTAEALFDGCTQATSPAR